MTGQQLSLELSTAPGNPRPWTLRVLIADGRLVDGGPLPVRHPDWRDRQLDFTIETQQPLGCACAAEPDAAMRLLVWSMQWGNPLSKRAGRAAEVLRSVSLWCVALVNGER